MRQSARSEARVGDVAYATQGSTRWHGNVYTTSGAELPTSTDYLSGAGTVPAPLTLHAPTDAATRGTSSRPVVAARNLVTSLGEYATKAADAVGAPRTAWRTVYG